MKLLTTTAPVDDGDGDWLKHLKCCRSRGDCCTFDGVMNAFRRLTYEEKKTPTFWTLHVGQNLKVLDSNISSKKYFVFHS